MLDVSERLQQAYRIGCGNLTEKNKFHKFVECNSQEEAKKEPYLV